MMADIDYKQATILLNQAYTDNRLLAGIDQNQCKDIEWVMNNNHLTYKYILLNALLGKSCADINPLVLQKGAVDNKSWDARSICHKVIVPFETTTLERRLGGSNEPFLNKPARFPTLSATNPVRRGNDKEILLTVIKVLSQVNSSKVAYDLLVYCLRVISKLTPPNVQIKPIANNFYKRSELSSLLTKILENKCDGESLAFGISIVLRLIHKSSSLTVKSHPTNQSGASSKEVSDIDIIDENAQVVRCYEIKDKDFNVADVRHAIKKVINSSITNLTFVYTSDTFRGELSEIVVELENEFPNFDILFIDGSEFIKLSSYTCLGVDSIVLTDAINKTLSEMRVKSSTLEHIRNHLVMCSF